MQFWHYYNLTTAAFSEPPLPMFAACSVNQTVRHGFARIASKSSKCHWVATFTRQVVKIPYSCMHDVGQFVAGKLVDWNIHEGDTMNAVLGRAINVKKEAFDSKRNWTFTSMSAIQGPSTYPRLQSNLFHLLWNHSKWCIVWSLNIQIQWLIVSKIFLHINVLHACTHLAWKLAHPHGNHRGLPSR